MKNAFVRVGCILLAAGLLASCSLLPSASPLPEPKPEEQPLYNADPLNDGKLRILYPGNGASVLCGSKVLYQGRTTDSLSLVTDSLTGETPYYFLAWSDNTIPSGRRSALCDKDGKEILQFERDYNAFQTGNLLVLSNEGSLFDNSHAADPESCRVIDLSTGSDLPRPENAVNCVVAGDQLLYTCYDRPAELGEDEYDDEMFAHMSVLLCDRAGNLLDTRAHTRAYGVSDTSISSEWVELYFQQGEGDASVLSSSLWNTATGEEISGYTVPYGNGIIGRNTEDGRYQILDIVSTEQPAVICEFDSSVSYYAPDVALLWAKDHDDYSYEFHDLTTGEVKKVYNADANDKTLAFYAADGTLRVYDKSTGALLTDLTVELPEKTTSVQVSAEGADYVTLTFSRSGSLDHPLVRLYNAEGLIRETDMKDFAEDYYFVAFLLFANGQPYFRAQYEGPNGTSLSDVLDVQGNVVVAGLPLCYSYYTSSQNALPEGVFVAQKGFYYGWMDLNGQWLYCQNIFSAATDEDDVSYYD